VASAVQADLSASIGVLQVLASSNDLDQRDFAGFHREMQRVALARPDLRQISVSDVSGQVILRSNAPADAAPVTPLEPDSLAKARDAGKPVVGSLVKGRLGEYAYPVRVPVTEAGRLTYVLTAAVVPRSLVDILERQNRPNDWVIAVLDAQGTRLARSRDHDSTVGSSPSPSLADLLSSNLSLEGVGITRATEGDLVVTAFVRIPLHGWTVVIGAPLSLLQAASTSTLTLYALGVGGSLLVAIPLALTLSRRIRRDIQLVIDRADKIGSDAAEKPAEPTIAELATLMRQVDQANDRVREALDAAERASSAKDQFMAVLGHELRNPLAPISSVLTLLDAKAGDTLGRERQILRRQVAHMTRLVDDLLDVSRLVEGKVSLNREPVELGQLVGHAVESFCEHETGAQVQGPAPSEAIWVDADPVRLTQVITNLLINAFRHGGGQPIHVTLHRRGQTAELTVVDHGDGMAPETLSRVFEPFYQVRANPGTLGLGLAIVQSIVERHGGNVRASSAGPGEGSTFVVGLPLHFDPA
jgi:signal transduction histidine kinase